MRIISDKVLAFGKFEEYLYGFENLFSADEQAIIGGNYVRLPEESDVEAASKILNSNGYIAKDANTDKPCEYWLDCLSNNKDHTGVLNPVYVDENGNQWRRGYGHANFYTKRGYRPVMWVKL